MRRRRKYSQSVVTSSDNVMIEYAYLKGSATPRVTVTRVTKKLNITTKHNFFPIALTICGCIFLCRINIFGSIFLLLKLLSLIFTLINQITSYNCQPSCQHNFSGGVKDCCSIFVCIHSLHKNKANLSIQMLCSDFYEFNKHT